MTNANAVSAAYPAPMAGLVSVDGRTYPLKSAQVKARAEGGIAATTLIQSYENPYQEPLEVLYTLPLPAQGAVIGYTMRLGERVIRGEVRRRAEAQEEYRKALVEGRTAALLEQERADTFTQKLGCLPPGQGAQIEIEVLQPLAFLAMEGGQPPQWEYRFPTVAGIRYEGAAGRVPDAGKLDVDRASGEGAPVRLEAGIFIADGTASMVQPQAPGLEIDLEERRGGVAVTVREKIKLDRDLVFRWTAAHKEVGVRVVEGKGLGSDDGRYVLITVTPPAAVRQGMARDLTVLIDASGSMSGKPISRAKTVVEELLRSLDAGDRFEILAFANHVRRLVPGPVEANEKNIRKALEALADLDAQGSTEMTAAIVEALAPLRRDAQRQVILLSDGYIGFENEVIGEIMRRLVPGARVHVVGIGSAPNRTLTRGAARAGRGVEILVGDDADARSASQRLLKATVRPVLTDVEVKGSALVALAPQRAQDVLAGQPLVLLAEVSAAAGNLEISASQAGASGKWSRRIEVAPAGEVGSATQARTDLPLGALFGREAIEDVELECAAAGAGGATAALEKRIEALGLRHGIASRKTSLIAISEDPTVDPKDPRRRERLAVEVPAEVSAEGAGLSAPMMMALPSPPSQPRGRSLHSALFLSDERTAFKHVAEESDSDYSFDLSCDMPQMPESATVDVFDGRVLWLDGPRLICEFEAPVAGLFLPDDGAVLKVYFPDGSVQNATVLGGESSHGGPHHLGLTVRLALMLDIEYSWPQGEVQIAWYSSGNLQVNLHVQIW